MSKFDHSKIRCILVLLNLFHCKSVLKEISGGMFLLVSDSTVFIYKHIYRSCLKIFFSASAMKTV